MKLTRDEVFFSICTCFVIFFALTAQTLWSTIHGDGAVYASLIKTFTESGLFLSELPNWSSTEKFAEHPYLFFIFSSLFTFVFGLSDLSVKIPNYIIAALTFYLIYQITSQRRLEHSKKNSAGLFAVFVLLINSTYLSQVSQPTLDPMAQLLALFSVFLLLYRDRYFISGFVLGLAFLTKGLELLPNLGAVLILIGIWHIQSPSKLFKSIIYYLFGVMLVVSIWLFYDKLVFQGAWLKTYWFRQFETRFFMKSNMHTAFDFGFLKTFFSLYAIELIVFFLGFLSLLRKNNFKNKLLNDSYYLYFILYSILNLIAFSIIKKDSSQHMTGVVIVGSVIVSEFLFEFLSSKKIKYMKSIVISGVLISFIYWSWFMINHKKNPDIWTKIKNISHEINNLNSNLPIVVKRYDGEYYGLFYTSAWYLSSKKVFNYIEARDQLSGQEVIAIEIDPENNLMYSIGIYTNDEKK